MTLFVTRLARTHTLDSFDSGSADLDAWLRSHARRDDQRYHTAAVWVLCDDEPEGGTAPIGYYTLSTHAVAFAEVSRRELPQSGQWPDPVPALLVGRLAVDRRWQDRGLGTRLLRDAVDKALHVVAASAQCCWWSTRLMKQRARSTAATASSPSRHRGWSPGSPTSRLPWTADPMSAQPRHQRAGGRRRERAGWVGTSPARRTPSRAASGFARSGGAGCGGRR